MTDPLAPLWAHNISLARYAGAGSLGDIYDDPEPCTALVIPGERMYRTADGREKLGQGTVYLPAGIEPPPLQSEVTCASPGMHGRVGAVTVYDAGNLALPECTELVID